MTNRVYISPSVFKVSLSGFDASTAARNNLAFDAYNSGRSNGSYLAGTFAYKTGVTTIPVVVTFGKTFTHVPQCVFMVKDNFGISSWNGMWTSDMQIGAGSAYQNFDVIPNVSTTQVSFQIDDYVSYSRVYTLDTIISYIIFQ